MKDIESLNIKSAQDLMGKGELTSIELTQYYLNKIKERDSDINAYIQVFDDALDMAKQADERRKRGESGPLLGIPVAIKDNMVYKGKNANAGSAILGGFMSPVDSTVVSRLKQSGAVILGRANMDEFAMGSSTESSVFGLTKNPKDLERVPGGSSGGSAAALAGDMAMATLGSDTGGSIRQPASFCGVIGLKPTYGRISRSGLIALASSLDQIGPFSKTVSDAEILYDVLKGKDKMDSTTIDDDTYEYGRKFSKVIGVPRSFVESEGVDDSVKKNFKEAIDRFESLGYKVKDIELPSLKYSLACYYIIMPAEASSNLARFDGVKYGLHVDGGGTIEDYFKTRAEGFGKEVRRRIILGTHVLSSGYYDEYYGQAISMKNKISEEFYEIFKEVDFMLTPTTPTKAFKIGEKTSDPLSMYLADIFTVPANIAGLPSMSVPSGEDEGMPLGILLTAEKGREDNLFVGGKDFLGE